MLRVGGGTLLDNLLHDLPKNLCVMKYSVFLALECKGCDGWMLCFLFVL